MTMKTFSITLALFTLPLHHYVFSFQRFTLKIARRHAMTTRDVGELQLLMTPTRMGALGWLSTLSFLGAAVALGFAFRWWWGIVYIAFVQLVMGGIVPLFRCYGHFEKLAELELTQALGGPNAPLASRLIIDVIRAEDRRANDPSAT
jgi:hypothetical protein